LDDIASLHTSAERTWAELSASVASLIDAIACLIFQVVLTSPGPGARLFIILLIDPIACILGYWVMYQRLRYTKPKLAELGFYFLVLGTLFVICQCVVEESASLNLVKLDYSTASGFDALLELLVTLTVPVGLAIYGWLIATSPRLRRWLGFMLGAQVVLVLTALGSFVFPRLGNFVNSELFAVLAIIPTLAKAVWFLSPVDVSKSAAEVLDKS
jgi:prolipoprotein diacylglyceryltransferase